MDEIYKTIGERLKETRLERKLSREQVARRIGVTQQCIEKYEKGEIQISISRLIKISNVLNVGIVYLLNNDSTFKHFVEQQIKTHN